MLEPYEDRVRELVARYFVKQYGGSPYLRSERIAAVNKVTRQIMRRVDLEGWPETEAEFMERFVAPEVARNG